MEGSTIPVKVDLNFGIGSESRYGLEPKHLWGQRNRFALFRKAEILGEGKRILELVVRAELSGLEGKRNPLHCGPIISKESTGAKRINKRINRTSTRMRSKMSKQI